MSAAFPRPSACMSGTGIGNVMESGGESESSIARESAGRDGSGSDSPPRIVALTLQSVLCPAPVFDTRAIAIVTSNESGRLSESTRDTSEIGKEPSTLLSYQGAPVFVDKALEQEGKV